MELLVATLAYISPGRDVDVMARLRLIADAIRNAPGLVNARFYHGREPDACYFMLTAWEDDEWWQKAQERHSPQKLLMGSASELLVAPPAEWRMRYLWGYSSPAAQQASAAAHLITIGSGQAARLQQGWMDGLRKLAIQPTLAFAFLARSVEEENVPGLRIARPLPGVNQAETTMIQRPLIFLNLLSWPGEVQREDFYADPDYKALRSFLSSVGTIRILELDPL